MNDGCLGKGWICCVIENGASFEVNQLLFADDTALVSYPEEKFCILVGELTGLLEFTGE